MTEDYTDIIRKITGESLAFGCGNPNRNMQMNLGILDAQGNLNNTLLIGNSGIDVGLKLTPTQSRGVALGGKTFQLYNTTSNTFDSVIV